MIEFGFASVDLERIELVVLEFNNKAIRCYTRCGFREVQRSPNAAIVDRRSYDDVSRRSVEALWPIDRSAATEPPQRSRRFQSCSITRV